MATDRLPSSGASTTLHVRRPFGPTSFDRSTSIGELVLAVHRRRFGQLLDHLDDARLGDDPEEIHDVRVATRRIRALLRVFPEVFPDDEAIGFRSHFGWLGDALGAVRDLDVQIDQCGMSDEVVETRSDLAPLIEILHRRRSDARANLSSALGSERFDQLVSTFAVALDARRPPTPAAAVPALAALPPVLERLWRRVRKPGRKLSPDSSAEAFHRVRIRGKLLRYGTEAVSELYGKPAKRMIRRLVGVQDVLGAHQDAEVLVAHLRDLALDRSLALELETVFAMGRLARDREREGRKLRRRFEERFGRLPGAWNRLEKAMRSA